MIVESNNNDTAHCHPLESGSEMESDGSEMELSKSESDDDPTLEDEDDIDSDTETNQIGESTLKFARCVSVKSECGD